MQRIQEDIKTGQLKQAYLLYGDESYLRKQYRDKLKEALLAEDDTMNYQCFEGKDSNPLEIIDLAETMPFFAERRVIVIQNSGYFKKSADELADYIKNPAQTVYFVFVEEQVDKRNRLFKAVKDFGYAAEFRTQEESVLKRWVLGLLKKENKKISEAALYLFFVKTGTDMENIKQELEKLICYTLEAEAITEADVEAICTTKITNRIFDMINAIAEKRKKQALDLYYDLLSLKEPPMRILYLIGRQFNYLLQVKNLRKKGYDNRTIAQKTGLHSFVVGKYVTQASKFTENILRKAIEDCVDADECVKKGKMNDSMSVEILIVKYSA